MRAATVEGVVAAVVVVGAVAVRVEEEVVGVLTAGLLIVGLLTAEMVETAETDERPALGPVLSLASK